MAATAAAAMRAALRSRCPRPIGLADHAPKQAHGGRSPCRSLRTISSVKAASTTMASTANIRRCTCTINSAPSTNSNQGSVGIAQAGAPNPRACVGHDSPAASFEPPATTNDMPTITAAMTLMTFK
jgi:hypothetical protein